MTKSFFFHEDLAQRRKERKAIQKGPCNALLVRCNAASCLEELQELTNQRNATINGFQKHIHQLIEAIMEYMKPNTFDIEEKLADIFDPYWQQTPQQPRGRPRRVGNLDSMTLKSMGYSASDMRA